MTGAELGSIIAAGERHVVYATDPRAVHQHMESAVAGSPEPTLQDFTSDVVVVPPITVDAYTVVGEAARRSFRMPAKLVSSGVVVRYMGQSRVSFDEDVAATAPSEQAAGIVRQADTGDTMTIRMNYQRATDAAAYLARFASELIALAEKEPTERSIAYPPIRVP